MRIPDPYCPVYAILNERPPIDDNVSAFRRPVHNVTVCGGNRKRKSVVYVTSTNRVDVGLQVDSNSMDASKSNAAVVEGAANDDGPYFLLHYQGQRWWRSVVPFVCRSMY